MWGDPWDGMAIAMRHDDKIIADAYPEDLAAFLDAGFGGLGDPPLGCAWTRCSVD
jgi:hypothetical protein